MAEAETMAKAQTEETETVVETVAETVETVAETVETVAETVETVAGDGGAHALRDRWNLHLHLCEEKSWDLASYRAVQLGISTAEEVVHLCERVHENLLKRCMFFVMRAGISPQWEDPRNRNGGCFSFKVAYRQIHAVWRQLFYAVCGESLCREAGQNARVNGLTVSPKKNFCILKVWFADCGFQDPAGLVAVAQLNVGGCLFRKHEPEF